MGFAAHRLRAGGGAPVEQDNTGEVWGIGASDRGWPARNGPAVACRRRQAATVWGSWALGVDSESASSSGVMSAGTSAKSGVVK